jgi:hypothetical protein
MKRYIALIAMITLLIPSLLLPVSAFGQKKRAAKVERETRPESRETGEEFEQDADAPRGGLKGISRLDYMRMREQMVNKLRGYPLPPNVTTNLRAEAIQQMERQESAQKREGRQNVVNSPDTPQANSTSWTQIGPAPIPNGQTTGTPTPVAGRVLAIAVHPTNPNLVYAGTAQGGLYRSLDGGASWFPLFDRAQSQAVGAIAIDPVNPSTVWVGTGEGNFCGDCFFGVGVYRIRNADTNLPVLEGPFNTATNTNGFLANSRSITKILVNPSNNNQIFVATGSGVAGIGGTAGLNTTQRGLFRSDNAQSAAPTFTKLNVNGATGTGTNPGKNTAVRDIEFEPGNPNNLLAAVADTIDFTTSGVWRSTNATAADPTTVTFTRTLVSPAAEQAFNIQLAINKVGSVVTVYAALDEGDATVCAAQNANGNFGLVKKSVDGGVTWSAAQAQSCGFAGGQGFYDLPIAVDPNNANNLMIGGSGDYDGDQTPNKRSIDGGTTYVKASTGLHPDSHDIVFAPSNPSVAYHGNDGGIWRSADGGLTWTSRNTSGFSATQFVDLSTHPTDRYFMIGGTQDNGTPFLQPNNVWKLGDFGDGGYSLIDQNATDNITVTAYHTYFNATNAQIGFVRADTTAQIDPTGFPIFYGCGGVPNGISCSDATLFYAPMAQGPGNPNTIYFGAQKLYRSADKGVTMPAVSQTFTAAVSSIGISQTNDNVRIVGVSNGGLFGTITGANPLVDLDPTNTVPNQFISRTVIDPSTPTTAYVTLNGYGLAAGQHVYKTTNLGNSGTTWAIAGNGIPDVPVNAFAIDPTNSSNLYAGTDIGVYRSTNGGTSWTPFSDGLPRVAVFDMEFQARNNPAIRVLRVATHGRGIWQVSVAPAQKQRGDFDQDGKTDIAVWHGSTSGNWEILNSTTGFDRVHPDWGKVALTDKIVPGDYDNDNKVDFAVYRASEGNWYVANSADLSITVKQWGQPGDIPVPGDYDGDGKSDYAVFRPAGGEWWVINSSNNTSTLRGWGANGDKPVPGDYDGDGKTDFAVFRPSDGNWYIINSGNGSATVQNWGLSTDRVVPADYDGDNKTDLAVYRNGDWYIRKSTGGTTVQNWGNASGDFVVPADYDGDGKADLAVWRKNEGNWYILLSSGGSRIQNLGQPGDTPVPVGYLPNEPQQ